MRKIATYTIRINRVGDDLETSSKNRLTEIPAGTVEEKWDASKGELGTAIRKHEDWSDGNRMELEAFITNKNLASKKTKSVKAICRTCRQPL